MSELSVIIVNWNSKDLLRQCLVSLQAHCRVGNMEVIVIDGGSFDGCDQMLATEFREVRFIQCPSNVGFAKANNIAARQAIGKFLLFLNPDTQLLEDSPAILLREIKTLPQAGAVGCKLLNGDGSLQTTCVQAFPTLANQVFNSEYLRTRFFNWKMWGIAALYAEPPGSAAVEAISGACILMSRELFERLGGFSERYFMYGEDIDLCFRIQQAGSRVYYIPETRLIHYGGGSSRKSTSNFASIMMSQSIHSFLRANRGPLVAASYRAAMSCASLLRLVIILILLPVSRNRRLVRHGTGSLRKWVAIFRWASGLETWAHGHS